MTFVAAKFKTLNLPRYRVCYRFFPGSSAPLQARVLQITVASYEDLSAHHLHCSCLHAAAAAAAAAAVVAAAAVHY
jgi:hypothetical protein